MYLNPYLKKKFYDVWYKYVPKAFNDSFYNKIIKSRENIIKKLEKNKTKILKNSKNEKKFVKNKEYWPYIYHDRTTDPYFTHNFLLSRLGDEYKEFAEECIRYYVEKNPKYDKVYALSMLLNRINWALNKGKDKLNKEISNEENIKKTIAKERKRLNRLKESQRKLHQGDYVKVIDVNYKFPNIDNSNPFSVTPFKDLEKKGRNNIINKCLGRIGRIDKIESIWVRWRFNDKKYSIRNFFVKFDNINIDSNKLFWYAPQLEKIGKSRKKDLRS